MRLKTISWGLLGGGIVMLFYALTMDVSVSGMYNLNKGSDRNLIMMLGGILFIAGIVVFVADRTRKDSGQASPEPDAGTKALEEIRLAVKEVIDEAPETTAAVISKVAVAGDDIGRVVGKALCGLIAGAFAVVITNMLCRLLLLEVLDIGFRTFESILFVVEIATLLGVVMLLLKSQRVLTTLCIVFLCEFLLFLLLYTVVASMNARASVLADMMGTTVLCGIFLVASAVIKFWKKSSKTS